MSTTCHTNLCRADNLEYYSCFVRHVALQWWAFGRLRQKIKKKIGIFRKNLQPFSVNVKSRVDKMKVKRYCNILTISIVPLRIYFLYMLPEPHYISWISKGAVCVLDFYETPVPWTKITHKSVKRTPYIVGLTFILESGIRPDWQQGLD